MTRSFWNGLMVGTAFGIASFVLMIVVSVYFSR